MLWLRVEAGEQGWYKFAQVNELPNLWASGKANVECGIVKVSVLQLFVSAKRVRRRKVPEEMISPHCCQDCDERMESLPVHSGLGGSLLQSGCISPLS